MNIWFCKYNCGFESFEFSFSRNVLGQIKKTKRIFKIELDWLNKYLIIGFWDKILDYNWQWSWDVFYIQLRPLIIKILNITLIDRKGK